MLVAVDLAAPRPENKPPVRGAAAGVADGVLEEVVLPKPNIGLAGVVDVVGVVEDSLVAVVTVGGLKSDGACAPCPPAAGVAVGPPKRGGLVPLSALVVTAVVDSAGLFPKRPPPVGADGVDPNIGFCCCVFPKRPPPDCGCDPPPNSAGVVVGAVAVVAAVGVVDEVVLGVAFPKRPPTGFCAGWPKRDCPWPVPPCGGGPAGVVDVLPKRPAPAGAGVAVFPNKPPAGFGALPNNPPLLA